MTFEVKYSEEDFLNAMNGGLKTIGFITRKVGCSRKTTELYLNQLLSAGKIEKIPVDEGKSNVWKVI